MVALLSLLVLLSAPQPQSPQVVKISAGPSGTEANGVLVLTEERSTFNRTNDREVLVFFQWDGTPGLHKLTAEWRSPDGGTTTSAAFDYVAKDRRFGAYWRLAIAPTMALGTWSIQASVDGQPAGRFTFDLTDAAVAPGAARKVPLTQAQIYERLTRVFVALRRLAPNGRELDAAAGYAGGTGTLFTALAAVDDVDRVQAIWPDGSSADVTALVGWNRRQDWAVLQAVPGKGEALPVASPDTLKVGERCFSMDGGPAGGRALVEGTITGHASPATGGKRLLATFLNGIGTPGAPVLNEYGELVGIVGAADVPGVSRMLQIMRFRAQLRGTPILPLTDFRVRQDAVPQLLAEMRARGELIAALSGDEHVLSGGFARAITRGAVVAPEDQSDQFAMSEKQVVVFITWSPQERLRGTSVLRVHDSDNQLVAESKPGKTDVRKRDLKLSSWTLPMFRAPGTYRADVLFNDKPVWRGFVRIHP